MKRKNVFKLLLASMLVFVAVHATFDVFFGYKMLSLLFFVVALICAIGIVIILETNDREVSQKSIPAEVPKSDSEFYVTLNQKVSKLRLFIESLQEREEFAGCKDVNIIITKILENITDEQQRLINVLKWYDEYLEKNDVELKKELELLVKFFK